ncbi:DUF3331 domain-containing protein [Burkholderia contaminans]|uniref:DUF3331 domain-containing protein n=1 Tax=Burkholderia contaminans TaxID=488447 RepID=UPI001588A3C7
MVFQKRRANSIDDPYSLVVGSIPISRAYGNVLIKILEKSSERLLVQWREPGRCHYGEQIWKPRFARKVGVCAYSGLLIEIGDSVYMPSGRYRPSNYRSMILVDQIID